jgi:DnaJ-class molecular chaperone
VTKEMIVGEQTLNCHSSANEIKKAYLKAARHIHPDKTVDMLLEERLIADEVFIVLTDEYNAYKRSKGLV